MFHGLLKQNWIGRLSETELSMEDIHHHVRQFVHGTKNYRTGTVLDRERSGRTRTSIV